MFGPFALQWRAPSPNPPAPNKPLPPDIRRSLIPTASGPLELLYAPPANTTTTINSASSSAVKPPLFFAHGGFGCASVWLAYMMFFSQRGHACYAVSYRGHGNSWYPGFWQMYFTSRGRIAEDLVAGMRAAERMETQRRKADELIRMVLVSHSAGGALSQYVLSRGMIHVQGFCMFAAVPGFGSWSCYKFWLLSAPLHFYYRFFHSRYLLATTAQVHAAFFTTQTPISVVRELEQLLAPYESMCWPMQALSPFVTGPDVIQRIMGWKLVAASATTTTVTGGGEAGESVTKVSPRMLILAAEQDVLCTPPVLFDAAQRYRAAFRVCVQLNKVEGVAEADIGAEGGQGEQGVNGVRFKVVRGVGHHLQNHVDWKLGAEEILEWVKKL